MGLWWAVVVLVSHNSHDKRLQRRRLIRSGGTRRNGQRR